MRMRLLSERCEGLLAAAIVLAVLTVLYFSNLGAWLINDDEGSFLYQVWRMTEGEQPYRDFFSSREPLFLYTGAVWMRLWGPDTVAMRALSIAATLATGFLIYLLASSLASRKTALIAMLAFLLHPHVVDNGRVFQPEPFFLLLVVLGLLLVEYGLRSQGLGFFVLAGVAFGAASLFKLLAILALGGCALYLAVLIVRKARPLRQTLIQAAGLILTYAFIHGGTVAAFAMLVPGFVDGVIGIHLAQGSELPYWRIFMQGGAFFIVYAMQSSALLLASVPALAGLRKNPKRMFVACQLPTAAAFLLLSRGLLPRHLYYLLPSFVILMAISAEGLLRLERGRLYHFVLIGMVLGPWLVTDAQLLSRSESDTMAVADLIASQTAPDDLVVSDYQELNFHAQRASTYHGAEISYVITDGGALTADLLIAEMETGAAQLLLIDVSEQTGHHLVALRDYDKLRSYVQKGFQHIETVRRQGQELEIYRRIDGLSSD